MFWLKVLTVFCAGIVSASAQEVGNLESFGQDGRLYSTSGDEYYLLSRQSYTSEDSRGYQGQVRIVKKYPGGGYEIKMKDYVARCFAPFDNMTMVMMREVGQEEYSETIDIKSSEKTPSASKKDAYNLFWAACQSQFRKFK